MDAHQSVSRALAFAVALGFTANAYAQETGWSDLGRVLGGELDRIEEDAYRDQLYRNYRFMNERNEFLQAQADLQSAQEAKEFAIAAARVRDFLAAVWQHLGLPEGEARAVADVYEPGRDQVAINARAHRDGTAATMDRAKAAYRDYQYQLANQLIVAAVQTIPPGVAEANAAIAALDEKYSAEDALYLVRRPLLSAEVAKIKQSMPADQWARATAEAYERIALIPVEEAQRLVTELENP